MEHITLNAWIGEFESALKVQDFKELSDLTWYDWFCKSTSLPNKTKRLGRKVRRLAKSEKVDTEKMYVFFKNNCPMNGPLYDDFRFCDFETGDVVYTVIPKCGHSGLAEVWGKENNFTDALVKGTWKEVVDFFLK